MTARPIGSSNGAWVLSPVRDGDWRTDALCAIADDKTLWDEHIDGETRENRADRHEQAKAICGGCPVRTDCLADFERGRDEGIRDARQLPPITEAKPHRRTEIAHGTERGAGQHRRRKEKPCQPCAEAAARAHADRDRRKAAKEAAALARQQPAPCGTLAAHKRHYLAGETCEPCREARNAHDREARRRRMAAWRAS